MQVSDFTAQYLCQNCVDTASSIHDVETPFDLFILNVADLSRGC